MEPLGAASACITLVEATAFIGFTATKLYRASADAPQDLWRLCQTIDTLQALLDSFKDIHDRVEDAVDIAISEVNLSTLKTCLKTTWDVIEAIQTLCRYRTEDDSLKLRHRLKWALLDKRKVDDLRMHLRDAESNLALAIKPLELYITIHNRTLLSTLVRMQATSNVDIKVTPGTKGDLKGEECTTDELVRSLETTKLDAARGPSIDEEPLPQGDPAYTQWVLPTINSSAPMVIEHPWLRALGISGVLAWYWDADRTTYQAWLKSSLPSIFGAKVFVSHISVRHHQLGGGLQILRGFARICNVVPQTADIMQACTAGDCSKIKQMFKARTASPFDTTSEDLTPLFFAIKAGNFDCVKLLLNCGADANATFGTVQTSALQVAIRKRYVDIIRLLIKAGACTEYLDNRGWSILFYLWERFPCESAKLIKTQTMIDMLSSSQSISNFDFNARDHLGNSALARAKALQTEGSDIDILLHYGADPSALTVPFQFQPFSKASHVGTGSMTSDHIKLHNNNMDLNLRDCSGWTLLHIAAMNGDEKLMVSLLKKGADPHELTLPAPANVYGIAEQLREKTLSSEQIAKAMGEETYRKYLNALKGAGVDCRVDDEERDVYYDAHEGLTCSGSRFENVNDGVQAELSTCGG